MCTINWCCQKKQVGRFGGDASQMWPMGRVMKIAGASGGWSVTVISARSSHSANMDPQGTVLKPLPDCNGFATVSRCQMSELEK